MSLFTHPSLLFLGVTYEGTLLFKELSSNVSFGIHYYKITKEHIPRIGITVCPLIDSKTIKQLISALQKNDTQLISPLLLNVSYRNKNCCFENKDTEEDILKKLSKPSKFNNFRITSSLTPMNATHSITFKRISHTDLYLEFLVTCQDESYNLRCEALCSSEITIHFSDEHPLNISDYCNRIKALFFHKDSNFYGIKAVKFFVNQTYYVVTSDTIHTLSETLLNINE